jgi:hypothetical protein
MAHRTGNIRRNLAIRPLINAKNPAAMGLSTHYQAVCGWEKLKGDLRVRAMAERLHAIGRPEEKTVATPR